LKEIRRGIDLEVSREKIKYNIAVLKDMNIIDREGSNKIGKY